MKTPNYEGTHDQIVLLRERINEFLNENGHTRFGAGQLAVAAGLSHNTRQSINQFRKGKGLSLKTGRKLWTYFITNHPNETLNHQKALGGLNHNQIGYSLMNFLEVGENHNFEDFAKSMKGNFLLFREVWQPNINPKENIVIGRLYIDTPVEPLERNKILNVTMETEVKDVANGEIDRTVFDGYCTFHKNNISFVMRDQNCNPVFALFHEFDPYPEQYTKINEIFGSIFVSIGNKYHKAYRIAAKRMPRVEDYTLETLPLNSKKLDLFKNICKYTIHE